MTRDCFQYLANPFLWRNAKHSYNKTTSFHPCRCLYAIRYMHYKQQKSDVFIFFALSQYAGWVLCCSLSLSSRPLPKAWGPEGSAQHLTSSKEWALLDRDLRLCSRNLLKPLSQFECYSKRAWHTWKCVQDHLRPKGQTGRHLQRWLRITKVMVMGYWPDIGGRQTTLERSSDRCSHPQRY